MKKIYLTLGLALSSLSAFSMKVNPSIALLSDTEKVDFSPGSTSSTETISKNSYIFDFSDFNDLTYKGTNQEEGIFYFNAKKASYVEDVWVRGKAYYPSLF